MMTSILRPTLLRAAAPCKVVRQFHSNSVLSFRPTGIKSLLPPGPQVIEGGVNDPVILPEPNAAHGSYHWTFERLLGVGLIPLTIAPFVGQSLSPVLDATLGAAIIIHSHIGFDSCITDYVPKKKYGGYNTALAWILRTCTGVLLYTVYSFETSDVGITEAVRRMWKA